MRRKKKVKQNIVVFPALQLASGGDLRREVHLLDCLVLVGCCEEPKWKQ